MSKSWPRCAPKIRRNFQCKVFDLGKGFSFCCPVMDLYVSEYYSVRKMLIVILDLRMHPCYDMNTGPCDLAMVLHLLVASIRDITVLRYTWDNVSELAAHLGGSWSGFNCSLPCRNLCKTGRFDDTVNIFWYQAEPAPVVVHFESLCQDPESILHYAPCYQFGKHNQCQAYCHLI